MADDNPHPCGGPQENCQHMQWHSRGYLQHLDFADALQFVTFRLCDSVPNSVIDMWRARLQSGASYPPVGRSLQKRIEAYSDAGYGQCYLGNDEIARIVSDILLRYHGRRYSLIEWCIVPNHVHLLLEVKAGCPLHQTISLIKGLSAKRANAKLERKGRFWSPDYFDRAIRDNGHLQLVRAYIRANPVKAGLVKSEQEWPWGSAWERVLES